MLLWILAGGVMGGGLYEAETWHVVVHLSGGTECIGRAESEQGAIQVTPDP